MSNSQDPGSIPSYREEFKHSVDLFERSLQAYKQSNMDNQKTKFQEVMGEASHIMSETSPQFMNSGDLQDVAKLQTDFREFLKNPSSDVMKRLQQDINNLKNV